MRKPKFRDTVPFSEKTISGKKGRKQISCLRQLHQKVLLSILVTLSHSVDPVSSVHRFYSVTHKRDGVRNRWWDVLNATYTVKNILEQNLLATLIGKRQQCPMVHGDARIRYQLTTAKYCFFFHIL